MEANTNEVTVDVGGLTRYAPSRRNLGAMNQDGDGNYYKAVDVQALLATKAASAEPEQAVPEAVREFLQGLVDCKGGMVSGNQLSRRATELLAEVPEVPAPAPVQMILHCPKCGVQHVDAPDERTEGWTNPPHRSHLCHGCGNIWRPADVHTEGVKAIQTRGTNDSAPAEQHPDDLAVDRFAKAMKAKLAKSRAKGRSGWDDPVQCDDKGLADALMHHAHKGDPVDVANFAMMLHQRNVDVDLDIDKCVLRLAALDFAKRVASMWVSQDQPAEQPSTSVPRVASIDTSEFRKLTFDYGKALHLGSVPESSRAFGALVSHIEAWHLAHVARQDQATPATGGGLTEGQRCNAEMVVARLEQIKHIAEGTDARGLAIEALVCANAILAAPVAQEAAPGSAPIGYVERTQLEWLTRSTSDTASAQLWRARSPVDAVAVYLAAPSSTEASAQAVPVLDESVLHKLARRTLWIAYVWNDHNFEAAHKVARETCEAVGIKSFDEANRYLGSLAAAQAVPAEQRDATSAQAAPDEVRNNSDRYRWMKMTASPGDQMRLLQTPWPKWDGTIDALRTTSADSEKGGAA